MSTSVKTIADGLGGLSLQAWATTAFLITSTVSTPLYGKLSDVYGRRPLFTVAIAVCRSVVADDVDHLAVWVADEEAPDAPLLVGNRVHDLCARRAYRFVGGVDVIDLHAEVRVYGGRWIFGDEDDLGGGVGR